MRSRKRKREVEEVSPSAEVVSEKNLKETAPMVLASWKTTIYKSNSMARKLADVLAEMENATTPGTEEDFKPQKVNAEKGYTSGQMWEVDIAEDWISSQHQRVGKQMASDPLEKELTRNNAHSWWIALDTTKELEGCLKNLDRGLSRKRRNRSTQHRAEVNKLDLRSQLGRTWEKLFLEYYENEMKAPSSAQHLMANIFVRTERNCCSHGAWQEWR